MKVNTITYILCNRWGEGAVRKKKTYKYSMETYNTTYLQEFKKQQQQRQKKNKKNNRIIKKIGKKKIKKFNASLKLGLIYNLILLFT